MPLTDLYTYKTIKNDPGIMKVKVFLKKDHPLFKGHFPDNPVVPGVSQVEMVRRVLSDELNRNLFLGQAREIKFFIAIVPPFKEEGIDLNIEYKSSERSVEAKCIFSEGSKVFTKIRGVFSEER